MPNLEIAKWRDGADMICEVCGQPIYRTQPMYSSTTQIAKKRHCWHFFCDPNSSMTIIGNKGKG